MALNDAALVLAANAVDTAITHMQLHSGAPGAAGTTNVTSAARQPVNGSLDREFIIGRGLVAVEGQLVGRPGDECAGSPGPLLHEQ